MTMSWEQKWMKEIMMSEKRTAEKAEFQASDQRSKAVSIAEQSKSAASEKQTQRSREFKVKSRKLQDMKS